ncbi:MAG: twin-arginine translocation signal domain-containing protein [Planctomycetota bacterium]
MNRRQFLKTGAIATALMTAGRLPLLSAQTEADPGIDASTGPHAVKPIRDHLKRFSPVQTPLRNSGDYGIAYDIIHWNWINGRPGTYGNSVLGRVAIERRAAGDEVVYEINQGTRIGGLDNYLEARIVCEANDLNSVRRWRLSSYSTAAGRRVGPAPQSLAGRASPTLQLSEKGRCEKGDIRIESDGYEYGFRAENSVVTQWTVLDLLIRKAKPTKDVTFDLLQDLSLFKPGQSLTYDGVTPIAIKNGTSPMLQTYAQTGRGVLPIHYLLDEQRRPQLVTNSILSWSLAKLQY